MNVRFPNDLVCFNVLWVFFVLGRGELYRVPLLNADEWMGNQKFFDAKDGALKLNATDSSTERRDVREKMLKQIWTSNIGDVIDITNLSQTKTEFANAMAVMDTVNGWNQEGWAMYNGELDTSRIGGKLASRTCIFTKTVFCNGQRNME